jgi:hypothetical protein
MLPGFDIVGRGRRWKGMDLWCGWVMDVDLGWERPVVGSL